MSLTQEQLHDIIRQSITNISFTKYLLSRDYSVDLFNYKILFCIPQSCISFYFYKRWLIKSALLSVDYAFSDFIVKITDPFVDYKKIDKKLQFVIFPKLKEKKIDIYCLCNKFLEYATMLYLSIKLIKLLIN
jgi:hypothetical protein